MIINKTKFLEFKSVKSPSNNDWYYVKRTNDTTLHDSAVCITTLVKNDFGYEFLFLKTKRPPIYAESKASFCIESPAGLIGDVETNETMIDCIKKELLEETGYVADEIYVELTNSSASSGITSETLSYATAVVSNNNKKANPVSDGGIIVDRFFVPTDEIYDFINKLDKKECSLATALVCGVFFALKRI